jgi:hypothetical protein
MFANHEYETTSVDQAGAIDSDLVRRRTDSLSHVAKLKSRLAEVSYIPTLSEIAEACPDTNDDPSGSAAWEELTKEKYWGELLNTDFVNALATYLKERIATYRTAARSERILEIGAGNGHLAQALRQPLAEAGIDYVATDLAPIPGTPVEQLDYREALRKYSPALVISSWMPPQTDFTQAIRSTPSVQEYVLIGDAEMCGIPWETYGNHSRYSSRNARKPYRADGFARVNHLNQITRYQTAYRDPNPYGRSTSTVLAYRRKV